MRRIFSEVIFSEVMSDGDKAELDIDLSGRLETEPFEAVIELDVTE